MPSLLGFAAAAMAIGVATSPGMQPGAVQAAPQIVVQPAVNPSVVAVIAPRPQDVIETAALPDAH